jgi:hypothetical protein
MKNIVKYIQYGLFGFVAALAIHSMPLSGCSKDDDFDPDPNPDPIVLLDLEKANETAENVEKAFESGDVTQVLPFLTDQAKQRSQEDLENASQDVLIQFAADFNDRSIVGYGDEFIEYEFDWNGIPYTVDFAIQVDGSLKIIRL